MGLSLNYQIGLSLIQMWMPPDDYKVIWHYIKSSSSYIAANLWITIKKYTPVVQRNSVLIYKSLQSNMSKLIALLNKTG